MSIRRCWISASCIGVVGVCTTTYAQMSPEDAQRLMDEADRNVVTAVSDDNIALPSQRKATHYSELHPTSQQKLNEYAAQCVIINGDLWSFESLHERAKPTARIKRRVSEDLYRYVDEYIQRNGFVDPYETRNAPNYIRFRDDHGSGNESSAINWTRDELIADVPGVIEMSGEVMQVLDDGLLMRYGDDTWHVNGNPGSMIDGQHVNGLFRFVGTYEYISVMGTGKTIRDFDPYELNADIRPVPVTGPDVFEYITSHGMDYLPIYRPSWVVDESPSFGWRSTGDGSRERSVSASNLETRGVYHYEWRRIEKPVNLFSAERLKPQEGE